MRLPDLMSSSEVFSQLTLEERSELVGLAYRKPLRKGEVLCMQGDYWRSVFIIASGTLRSVIHSPDGRDYVVSSWENGEEFWSHTLLDDQPMPSTLEASKVSLIYIWPGEIALGVVLHNQLAVRALLKRQTQLIRKRRNNIYNLAFNPVAGRLAKLVVEKFASTDSAAVQRDLTLEDMAAMVASSPEVICRILYQFQSDGILKIDRASITVQDRKALENLADRDG